MGKNDKEYVGKYYLQHYESEYKPFYYNNDETRGGMNSCGSAIEPIEIDEADFDFKSTYIVEYSIKIHKMTAKENKEWLKQGSKEGEIENVDKD